MASFCADATGALTGASEPEELTPVPKIYAKSKTMYRKRIEEEYMKTVECTYSSIYVILVANGFFQRLQNNRNSTLTAPEPEEYVRK